MLQTHTNHCLIKFKIVKVPSGKISYLQAKYLHQFFVNESHATGFCLHLNSSAKDSSTKFPTSLSLKGQRICEHSNNFKYKTPFFNKIFL